MKALLEQIAKNTATVGKDIKSLKTGQQRIRSDVQDAVKRIDALEEANRVRSPSLPGAEDETGLDGKKFQFTRAIRYILTGNVKGNELEADILGHLDENDEEARRERGVRRDMIAGDDGLGGYIVPQQLINDLIMNLRAESVMLSAGATVMPNLKGDPVPVPKKTGSTTGFWVGETEEPGTSDVTVGQMNMSPKTMAAFTKLSKRLIRLSAPGAEQIVRADLTETMGLMLDLAGIRGSGSEGQPLGMGNWPSIGTYAIGANGGPITYDVLVQIMAVARNANALKDAKKVGWILPPQLIRELQLLKDANNRPLVLNADASIREQLGSETNAVGMLLGYPMYSTSQIPTNLTKGSGTNLTELYFGDLSTVVIGQWTGLELAVSDTAGDAIKKRQVWVYVFQDVDVAVRQPERLVLCNDVESQ